MRRGSGLSKHALIKRKHQIMASWIFGTVFALFLMVAFFVDGGSRTHDPTVRWIAAVGGGLFGFFLTGSVKFVSEGQWGKLGKVTMQSGGGLAVFAIVWFSWPSRVVNSDGIFRAVEQGMVRAETNLTASVLDTIKQTLNLMDTNRIRVEALTKQVEELNTRGEAYKQELERNRAQLADALVTIEALKGKLANVVQVSQLSPADQERVNKAAESAQKARSVTRFGTLKVGTVRMR